MLFMSPKRILTKDSPRSISKCVFVSFSFHLNLNTMFHRHRHLHLHLCRVFSLLLLCSRCAVCGVVCPFHVGVPQDRPQIPPTQCPPTSISVAKTTRNGRYLDTADHTHQKSHDKSFMQRMMCIACLCVVVMAMCQCCVVCVSLSSKDCVCVHQALVNTHTRTLNTHFTVRNTTQHDIHDTPNT